MRYREEAEFRNIKLSKEEKGDLEFGNGDNEPFDLVDIDENLEVIEVTEEET